MLLKAIEFNALRALCAGGFNGQFIGKRQMRERLNQKRGVRRANSMLHVLRAQSRTSPKSTHLHNSFVTYRVCCVTGYGCPLADFRCPTLHNMCSQNSPNIVRQTSTQEIYTIQTCTLKCTPHCNTITWNLILKADVRPRRVSNAIKCVPSCT